MKKKKNWIQRELKRLILPTPSTYKLIAKVSGSITGMVGAGFVSVNTVPGLETYISEPVKSALAYATLAAGSIFYYAQRQFKPSKKAKKNESLDS